MKAFLALEDGRIFKGDSFGARGEKPGEVVFNTSMTGYQEILTDPSYKGQIITMTYPLIGNYGINPEDAESLKPWLEGFVVRECSRLASNWRSQGSLGKYLKEHNIIGIEGIDTRALTEHIRQKGAMKAVISTEDLNEKRLIRKAKDSPGLIGRDLVKEVTSGQTYDWSNQKSETSGQKIDAGSQSKTDRFKVVVIDYGVKYNILRELANLGCQVIVVPASTKAEKVLKMKPDGLLLSNGPGDPEGIPYVVEEVRKIIQKLTLPIFGICLGHQILGLALGGKTYKLKFGHHGANHPVKDLKTGKVAITVQNHGFYVDIDSLNKDDLEITHLNLNDKTLEGMRHKKLPLFSVQFHPEASPGPHDTQYLFGEFIDMMKQVGYPTGLYKRLT
jgi:carbamoyl-phosphate synthase small subunit